VCVFLGQVVDVRAMLGWCGRGGGGGSRVLEEGGEEGGGRRGGGGMSGILLFLNY